jgi:DNA topoisomerase-1
MARRQLSEPVRGTVRAAATGGARLRHVTDAQPGLRRLRAGGGFRYVTARGVPVRSVATLRRIRALAVPPAWRDVWICADPRGHLQATGRDACGRKQHRYHPRWRALRDAGKFQRMLAFGRALPEIRRRVRRDLARRGLPHAKVVATIVRLLDETCMRVGNDEYARDNSSYGLTTLRNKHVEVKRGELIFEFRGKSGISYRCRVHDPRVARIVARCRGRSCSSTSTSSGGGDTWDRRT